MPLYEYECSKCGERFEVIQKFADKPLIIHEVCGGDVRRLLSVSALKFKGSGFYINDYAKGGGSGVKGGQDQNGKEKGSKENSKDASKDNVKATADASPSKTDSTSSSATPASSTSDTK